MKHQLEIKFVVGPGFAPAVNAKTPARSAQPVRTVLVILPDGKVVRRVQTPGEAAIPVCKPSSASALPRRLFLSVRPVRPVSAPFSFRN